MCSPFHRSYSCRKSLMFSEAFSLFLPPPTPCSPSICQTFLGENDYVLETLKSASKALDLTVSLQLVCFAVSFAELLSHPSLFRISKHAWKHKQLEEVSFFLWGSSFFRMLAALGLVKLCFDKQFLYVIWFC